MLDISEILTDLRGIASLNDSGISEICKDAIEVIDNLILERDKMRRELTSVQYSIYKLCQSKPNVQGESGGAVVDGALRFLYSKDLYGLLTDVQNGIDSPATCSIANSLIIRLDKIHAELHAAATTSPQPEQAGVPEGYALVLIEPTDAMLTAGDESGFRGYTGTWSVTPHACWKAMLAATPPAQVEE